MRFFRGFMRLGAGVGVLVLLGSFAGALHPVGDSLAVFRLWIAVGVVGSGLVLLALRDRVWGLYFVVLAAVSGIAPASSLMASNAGLGRASLPYSLYQRNLLFLSRDAGAILAEIEALEPDFLTLQEVSTANRIAIYDRLPIAYDRALCRFAGVGDVAVASRLPFVPGSTLCIERLGMVAAQVDTPEGRIWLTSVHLHWPWPHGQAVQVEQILPLISRMQGPVLIGGDFNMVRWSHVMANFERVSRSRLVRQGQPTFRLTIEGWRGPGLEIDHILLPETGPVEVERLDYLGSDHRGLIARFRM